MMEYSEREDWITMNDGVRLDVSVCTPAAEAPAGGWPGVLLVHGHGDTACKATMLPEARRMAQRGYVTVCYSVRGQGGSEGLSFHLGPRELFDLQDVIDWVLCETPVHPQKLGVSGASQGGWHAYMAAAHHLAVATVVPQNCYADPTAFVLPNNCLGRWYFTVNTRRRVMTAGMPEMTRQWALSGDWHRIKEWAQVTAPGHFVRRMRCPIFIVFGWDDMGTSPNDVLTMFEDLNAPKKLFLTGGGHGHESSAAATAFLKEQIDRWLDYWLKGEQNGIMDEPPILYARRPSLDRVAIDALPPADVTAQLLYLQDKGKLTADPPTQPAEPANVNNVPLDPDYTLRTALYDNLAGVGRALAREVVTFDGEPYADPVEVLGIPQVQFFMLPNRTFFQVHAELYDLAPDGSATMISRGHYGSRTAEPGRHLTVAFDLRAIGYQLAAGHRLRLAVSNCNTDYVFPYFEPFGARLFHDNAHPSALTVPLRRALNDS